MGDVRTHLNVLAVVAVSSRHESVIDRWFRSKAEENWGPIVLESPIFDFDQTSFYEQSMGSGLKKKLFALEQLIDPTELPTLKLQANEWEHQIKEERDWLEQRPINIDPGYVTEAKLVLATTKDRDHRIYLGDGVYAEVTLLYSRARPEQPGWQFSRWTYPDFKSPGYLKFFDDCRDYLRRLYRGIG